MDTNKPRRRVANKTRYQKNQATKKKARQHREVRSTSRDTRSYVRSQIAKFPNTFWHDQPYRKLLIILNDDKKTDRVLLQVHDIGKGNLYLALPIMNMEDLHTDAPKNSKEWIEAIKPYVRAHYGIEPRYVHDVGDYILLSRSKLVEPMTGLSPVKVWPFAHWHWYLGEDVARLSGTDTCIYSGKKLKEFIRVRGDVIKVHINHDTLDKIFQYRLLSGKLTEFHDEEPKPTQEGGEENG